MLQKAFGKEALRPLMAQMDPMEMMGKHYDRMCRRFKDPRLRAMFTFQVRYACLL